MEENKHEVVSFGDELQALIDYGHDCCARIDDKIHECCERIKKAHDAEVGSYAIALGWKQEQDQFATTYDVLGNDRHKAICELQKLRFSYRGTDSGGVMPQEIRIGDVCLLIGAFSKLQDDWPSTLATARDTLIYLLGGDANGMDAGRCGETGAGGGVPAADKRRADCADTQPSEGVAPVTQELRDYLEAYRPVETDTCMEVARIGTLGYQGIMERLDAIDAIHCLNGSALGDGIDWIIRKSSSVSATSVLYFFPSLGEINFSWLHIVTDSFPSFISLNFRTFQ